MRLRPFPRASPFSRPRTLLTRHLRPSSTSTKPPPPTPTPPSSSLLRLQSRLPPFLRPYLSPLLSAPLSHVTSFLLLHELTALLPLAGIFAGLHYSDSAPQWASRVASTQYFADGVERWGRYARRKGWVPPEQQASEEGEGEGEVAKAKRGEAPRVVLELAVAWAVTKVLLPVRIVLSVWATPWFARVAVVPVTRVARRIVGRGT